MSINVMELVRPAIQAMPAYEPILPFDVLSQKLGISQEELVKLDANENPYGALPQVLEALGQMQTAHIYPDPESRRIRTLVAQAEGLSPQMLVMSAGADELIDLLLRVLMAPGQVLLNCPPTFGMYAFDAELNQVQVASVPRLPDFSLDMPAIRAAVAQYQPKMLFLASPNNPDGSLLPAAAVEELLSLPLVLVLDEAYIEFAPADSSWSQRVADYNNLIVLRTFSKWAGLAGMRLGYGIFPQELVPVLLKAKQPYNVTAATELAACVTMQHLKQARERIGWVLAERQRLMAGLKAIPWLEPYPTQTNFILCRVLGRDAAGVKEKLMSQGILIRYFKKPGLRDHIRISVGTPEQTVKLLAALDKMEA